MAIADPITGSRVNPWGMAMIIPLAISLALLVFPQAAFIWTSFHEDTGFGQISTRASAGSYLTILSDPYYLVAFARTTYLAAATAAICVIFGYPTAYFLSRTPRLVATAGISAVLATALITIVIKLMGLNILLAPTGLINRLFLGTGLVSSPIQLVNNEIGVVIGLVQYTLPISILLLFAVAQTIPEELEEACAIHGATRAETFWHVILPLSRYGLVTSGLIAFNMSMGAFTSPVLLGGGRVGTVPVLIQQKIILDTQYALAAAMSVLLVSFVFALNVLITAVFAGTASERRSNGVGG